MEILIRIGVEPLKKFIAEFDTMSEKYRKMADEKFPEGRKIQIISDKKYVKIYVEGDSDELEKKL